jgi:hypothetical protein
MADVVCDACDEREVMSVELRWRSGHVDIGGAVVESAMVGQVEFH